MSLLVNFGLIVLLFSFLGSIITVRWQQIYSPQFGTTSLWDNKNPVMIKYKILTPSNQLIVWFHSFYYQSELNRDLKMTDDWPGLVGVNGMDAICKHEPLYCTLHCHLGSIFVLFIQCSVNKLQRGKSPQTCLCEAVCLYTSDTKQCKTECYCRMDVFLNCNHIDLCYCGERCYAMVMLHGIINGCLKHQGQFMMIYIYLL